MVDNVTYYFVKKFMTFPEYKDTCNVLVNCGMHTDFNKACDIATISEASIRESLWNNINGSVSIAKVVDMHSIATIQKKAVK